MSKISKDQAQALSVALSSILSVLNFTLGAQAASQLVEDVRRKLIVEGRPLTAEEVDEIYNRIAERSEAIQGA